MRFKALSIYDENKTLRILRHMGPISIDHFDDRLRLQKLAFLIQEMGDGGPFAYHWYIRGPYSPSLTHMLYSGDELGAYEDAPELTAPELGIARKVQAFMGSSMGDPLQLELYASVWYLAPDRVLSEEDKQLIVDRMDKEKPHFGSGAVMSALARIEKFRGHA